MGEINQSAPDFDESRSQVVDETTDRLTPEQLETRRIQNQSHEEWWADYDSYSDDTYPHIRRELNEVTKGQLSAEAPTNTGVKGVALLKGNRTPILADVCIDKKLPSRSQEREVKKELFIFNSFRTTKLGRLVISFISLSSGVMVDTFFNVSIKKLRGSGEHRTGKNGQFFPAPGSDFRKLWMDAVKEPPIRWSTVHKEMRSKLKGLVFEGETRDCFRESGEPYIQLIKPKYFGTELVQSWYKVGTELVQTFGTRNPMKHNTVKDFT